MDNQSSKMNNQETEIDLIQLLNALKEKILLIITITLVCAVIGLVLAAAVIKPTYTASAKLYVNNLSQSGSTTSGDINLQKSLVPTYIEFIKTYEVMQEVIEKTGVEYTPNQLIKMVSASQVGTTEIFQVKITCGDPEDAAVITNAIAEILPIKIAQYIKGADTSTVEAARVPKEKTGPSVTKYTAIGGILGLVVICAIIIIKELIDDRIHGSKDLTENYTIPVLTSVPDLMIK